jgi:spore photoproduct lyase
LERSKHRKAALKAWKTIRRGKREIASKNTAKIGDFISPETIEKIKHPETAFMQQNERDMGWQGNRIVVPFHKTPQDIACGMFWELRWAYGCPLNCSYCFLRGTMRGRMNPQYVRTELVLQALDEAFAKISNPTIFNSGELADSLMNPLLMAPIVKKFEEQNLHRVYLLSKFGLPKVNFLTKELYKQTICGWSINASAVSKRWEPKAASPENRIEAAASVSQVGYDTRIRIDPIFPIKEWRIYYGNLLDQIFSKLTPKRIMLGTPRGLWKTIKFAKLGNANLEWLEFFAEDSSWGKKLAFQLRKEIYEFFYDKLESLGYPQSKISLCKETVDMWKALKLKYVPGLCNCYGLEPTWKR